MKDIPHPHVVGHQDDDEHIHEEYVGADVHEEEAHMEEEEHQLEEPQDGVPTFPYHIQGGASGSSSHDLYIWEQVLENQRKMEY